MAVATWLVLGFIVAFAAHAVAAERLPLGMALVAGALGALLGATAESLIEGTRRFELDPASAAGAVAGAALLLLAVARAGEDPYRRRSSDFR